MAEDGYEEQIFIPKEKRELADQEGINRENKQKVTVQIMNLNTGESYTGRLAITGNHQTHLPLQGTSGQVYLPTEIQQMLKDSGKVSPSCRLYPPACKPYGLEAEPEAESRSWAGEKTPVESEQITRNESRYSLRQLTAYTVYFNRRHCRAGRLFQCRYIKLLDQVRYVIRRGIISHSAENCI